MVAVLLGTSLPVAQAHNTHPAVPAVWRSLVAIVHDDFHPATEYRSEAATGMTPWAGAPIKSICGCAAGKLPA